jgi:drug/metabolite transporter (DMT)-like permease
LAVTVATLGFNWPLLALGLQSIGPWWMAALRLVGAALVIWPLAAIRGQIKRPPKAELPVVMSVGTVRLLAVLILVLLALQRVTAGRSSVIVWTASLWTVPMAGAFLGERMTPRRWAGLATGIAGIVVLMQPWAAQPSFDTLFGYGLLLTAAIANAGTAVHVRGHQWRSTPLDLLPWQLLLATVPAVIVAFLVEGPPVFEWTPGLVGIVAYQGVLATALAVWSQITVLQRLPSITTNLTLMLVPVLGVLSSAAVLGESITSDVIWGGGLIAAGVLAAVTLEEISPGPTTSPLADADVRAPPG